MHKYIEADKLIDIYGVYPAGTMITLGNLIDAINSLPPEDVIPISFIREWLAAHPDPVTAAIREAWEANDG